MCIDEASDLFNECVSVKVWKHKFLLNTALSRKQKHPNYKLFDSYFQVDGKSINGLKMDEFKVKYFKVLDLIIVPTHTRFDQPSFIVFSLI